MHNQRLFGSTKPVMREPNLKLSLKSLTLTVVMTAIVATATLAVAQDSDQSDPVPQQKGDTTTPEIPDTSEGQLSQQKGNTSAPDNAPQIPKAKDQEEAQSPANTEKTQEDTNTTDINPVDTKPEKEKQEKPEESQQSVNKPEQSPAAKNAEKEEAPKNEKPVAAEKSDDKSAPAKKEEPASTIKTDTTPAETTAKTKPEEPAPVKTTELTIASWGGAYAKSQEIAYFSPFTKETGIKVNTHNHGGDFKALISSDSKERIKWDVVDLSLETTKKACKQGLLEKIEPSQLKSAPDGTPPTSDFLQTGLLDCGVASMAWSSAIIVDKRAFKKKKKKTSKPSSASDFFNLKKFPGKRALPEGPKYNLELALIAEGVAPDQVYKRLATNVGLTRALNKLETIYAHTIWWKNAHEPLKLLSEQKVVMATAYNGRAFYQIAGDNKPFDIIWDGQILNIDLWAIPKTSKNKEAALNFIAFATKPDRLAEQTKWFPYGPMRKSAIALIGNHAEVGIDMTPFIPTAGDKLKTAVTFDPIWWEENSGWINARFSEWHAFLKPEPKDDTTSPANAKDKPKNKNKR